MPKTPAHAAAHGDPGLAWFDVIACLLLRVYWDRVMGPILQHDTSLPKAERVATLQRMIRTLHHGEAQLTRAVHRAASRVACVGCPMRPIGDRKSVV